MADTRNRREVVDIGEFKPYTHPEHGAGAVREITYIDGTIERRFLFHDTAKEGEDPEAGYLFPDKKVDEKVRAEWDKNTPTETRTPTQTPDQAAASAATAQTAQITAADATRIANESRWNADPANKTDGGSGRYEDHATRDARLDKEKKDAETKTATDKKEAEAGRIGKPTGNTRQSTRNGTTVKETEYVLPDGGKEWRTQTEAGTPDLVGKPTGNTRARTENGQAIKESEYVLPDGQKEWRTQTAPVEGDKVPIPGDYPAYAPDYSHQDGDLGLTSYARQIRGLKNLTKEQQDQLIKEAHGVASTVVSRNTSTINTQEGIRNAGITQRGQDSTQANARLSAAASMSNTAISQAAEQTKYSTGPDAMAVAPYYMMLGRALVQSMGGLENTPRIEDGPALRQAGQMLMAGQGLPSVAGAIAGPNGPFPQPAMAAPALAAPMPMPPGATAGGGVGPPAIPMTPERVQGIMTNPAFRPQQPVQLPPAALPPAPSLGPGQDISAPQGAMPPGGMVAPMLGAGPWQQQPQPTGAVGVQMAAAQGYDPSPLNQMWLDAGIDPEIVAMFGGGAPTA